MSPEHDHNLTSINAPSHIEGLASVSERVVRKKEHKRQGGKQRRNNRQSIDEKIEEELAKDELSENDAEGHVDFHA